VNLLFLLRWTALWPHNGPSFLDVALT